MKVYKTISLAVIMLLVLIAFTSCMPNPEQNMGQTPSGFFQGRLAWLGRTIFLDFRLF